MIALPKPFRIDPKQFQPPKPKRLPERKPVSIAIGFHFYGGVVLCADTQFTTPGVDTSYGCKIWYEGADNWNVLFAFTGFSTFMRAFRERFPEAIKQTRGNNPAVNIAMVRDSIRVTLGWLDADERNDSPTGAEFICAIAVDSELSMYTTHGTLVSPVDAYCNILGGNSLTKYLSAVLCGNGHYNMGHAILAGLYMVDRAIAYIDGVGGDANVFYMFPSGTWSALNATTIYNLTQHLRWLDYSASKMSAGLLSFVDDQELENCIADLCARIREEHRELRRHIPRDHRIP